MNKKITEIIPEVKEQVLMRDFNTFHVGGMADYFYVAETVEDLINAVRTAYKLNLPYLVLGNGSNVLFSDYGFAGLVIKNNTKSIGFMLERSQLMVDSGVMLSRLITDAVAHDLAGVEFLYGVPGTVGGAVYGNAGAFGFSIGDYVKNVTLLEADPETEAPKVTNRDAAWMEFGYRTSKLKDLKGRHRPIILTVRFQFSRSQKEELSRRIAKYSSFRKDRPLGFSAGSVFKNPIPEELKNVTGIGTQGMPEVPKERTAGYLLEQAGAKKLKKGLAEVSQKHANYIIAKEGARANDIRSLIEEMREKVREKYDITLQEEIEYVGQW